MGITSTESRICNVGLGKHQGKEQGDISMGPGLGGQEGTGQQSNCQPPHTARNATLVSAETGTSASSLALLRNDCKLHTRY